MSTTDVTETDTPAPPPASPEPAPGDAGADEIVKLEERRRDAYRVG
jgi:hypothetical protein